MVKKILMILSVFVIIFSLSACGNPAENMEDEAAEQSFYTGNIIKNKETAIKIADVIMSESLNNDMGYYTRIFNVEFNKSEQTWTVSYGPDEIICGGDCSIKLDSKTGAVISVLYGE